MTREHDPLPQALSLLKHDLSTPLSVALGYLRMLLKEQAGPITEKQRKMLEESERSTARMSAFVGEMSDLGRLESGTLELQRQAFDLAALVAEVAGRMHERDDHGVRLQTRGTDRPLRVLGDRERIGTTVGTLLRLILREQHPGTVVVAECSVTGDTSPLVLVAIGAEATMGPLAQAASTGILIEEWKHGTGFALPIARRVVEAHGGSLWSAPGDRPRQPRRGLALRLPLNAT